jgi:hypothetical protein
VISDTTEIEALYRRFVELSDIAFADEFWKLSPPKQLQLCEAFKDFSRTPMASVEVVNEKCASLSTMVVR